MKHIQPIIFAACLLALACFGYLGGLIGAQNMLAFIATSLAAIFFLGSLIDKTPHNIAKHPKRPAWVGFIVRLLHTGTVTVLIWNGAWWTGIAMFVAIVSSMVINSRADDIRAAANESTTDEKAPA